MRAINIEPVTDLHAARRTLKRLTAALLILPFVVAGLMTGTLSDAVVPLLMLTPLLLLVLITGSALDANACELSHEAETSIKFPRPLELRG